MDNGTQLEYRDTDLQQLWNWTVVKDEDSTRPSPLRVINGSSSINRKVFTQVARRNILVSAHLKFMRIIRKVT